MNNSQGGEFAPFTLIPRNCDVFNFQEGFTGRHTKKEKKRKGKKEKKRKEKYALLKNLYKREAISSHKETKFRQGRRKTNVDFNCS